MKHNEEFDLDDLPEELKGDIVPEIDPAKLFDEKEYATLIIGSDDTSKKNIANGDLVTILVSPKTSREEKDEALIKLKENNATTILVSAIQKTKNLKQKASLLAACWETGLDFSKDYLMFVELVNSTDFLVSFEALTVILEMDAEIDSDTLKKAMAILKSNKTDNTNTAEAIKHINNKLNA